MQGLELHVMDFEGGQLIYRPLAGLAFAGNSALADYIRGRADGHQVERMPEVEAFLDAIGFWEEDDPPPGPPEGRNSLLSTVVLLLTNACNLRCGYCYARGGELPLASMGEDVARAAIDYVSGEASAAGLASFSLSLHGGGEPTLNWRTLRAAIDHGRSRAVPCSVSLASNGYWSEEVTEYVLSSVDSLTISFDGIEAVQDAQRPRAGGGPSYGRVLQTIRAVDASRIPYGLRLTITDEHVDRLPEIAAFLCEVTGRAVMQVEPCYSEVRGSYADPDPRQGERFADKFLEAYDIAASKGRTFFYSGSRPWLVSGEFCSAPREALIVTPDGDIVECFEVSGRDHPRFADFYAGSVAGGAVRLDEAKRGRFLSSRAARRASCAGCFNYRHCGGDCDSRALEAGTAYPFRCEVNRKIALGLIARYITEGGGVYRRALVRAKARPCEQCGQ